MKHRKNYETGEVEPVEEPIDELMRRGFQYAAANKLFFKTPFNHDVMEACKESATTPVGETMTQQNTRDEVDINNILEKFGVGQVARPQHGTFLDIDEHVDMTDAIYRMREAENAWDELPENVRRHFENPQNYLAYLDAAAARGDKKAFQDLNLIPPEPPPAAPPEPTPKGGTPAPEGGKVPAGGTT